MRGKRLGGKHVYFTTYLPATVIPMIKADALRQGKPQMQVVRELIVNFYAKRQEGGA